MSILSSSEFLSICFFDLSENMKVQAFMSVNEVRIPIPYGGWMSLIALN